jgi:hypothetical protein
LANPNGRAVQGLFAVSFPGGKAREQELKLASLNPFIIGINPHIRVAPS